MSVHGLEEDVNLVTNAGRQQQPTNSLNGLKESVKQNLFGDKDDEECHNLINSDNSGSECSSPKERARGEKSPKDSVKVSTFNDGENSQDTIEIRNSDAQIMETTQRLVHSNDQKLTDNDTRVHSANGDSLFSNEYHSETPQTTSHCPSTSQDCKRTNTIENNDYCGSPPSDITDPEVISQDNWPSRDVSLKPRKNGVYAESPSSDFECNSSCAEDSGISSTVRDDEMEEIPLADGALSPELFQEMSKLNVNDMVSSWVPKSNNTYSPSICKSNSASMQESQTLQNKRKVSDQNSVGWKLFGKVPPKESAKAQPFHRDDVNRSSFDNPASKKTRLPSLKKSNPSVTSSTTALIFENRPRNLPAKSATEEKKHRQQYEAMVANARKKELQEVKKQEKQIKQKNKQEKQIVNAASVWVSEILPNWETTKGSRKAKELWWQGLPPSIRGKVWKLAIGNDLQITYELFDIFQAHAFEKLIVTRNNKKRLKQSKSVAELPTNNFIPVVSSEHKVELIMLDVSRTFPSLCIFQEGGPFHDLLHSILGAYTCYRPDVGYVQGMSFIAAVLLLNMDPPDAFVCFANLLNKPCQLVFFRVDHPMMKAYFATFEILLEEFLPRIASLFVEENFSPDMYLIDWIFTLFSKSLPLDVACRVWDVFCRDGDDFLFQTALGILKHYQQDLMGMDFIHLGQFLTKLPDDVSANKLFDSIGSINLSRQKFNQILAQQKELATQIKTVTASAGK